jgi:hypothetical protein
MSTFVDDQQFEVADRYTVYIRAFCMARALEREGPGQDLELSAFWQSRYEAGIARMLKRRAAMEYQAKLIFGGRANHPSRRLARLPWPYAAQR